MNVNKTIYQSNYVIVNSNDFSRRYLWSIMMRLCLIEFDVWSIQFVSWRLCLLVFGRARCGTPSSAPKRLLSLCAWLRLFVIKMGNVGRGMSPTSCADAAKINQVRRKLTDGFVRFLIERFVSDVEWVWESITDDPVLSRYGTFSDCRQEVTFHNVYSSGTAVVRGNTPFLPDHHYYWEVKILTELYGTDVVSFFLFYLYTMLFRYGLLYCFLDGRSGVREY